MQEFGQYSGSGCNDVLIGSCALFLSYMEIIVESSFIYLQTDLLFWVFTRHVYGGVALAWYQRECDDLEVIQNGF